MNAVVAKLKPDIFAWSAKYRIGIAEVDQQHRKLVRLINTLARMHVGDEDPEALLKVFDELASYAAYHFKAEETLMRGYEIDPDFESAHIAAHASFVRQAGEARDVAYLNPNEVTTQTLTFLSRWLIYHILGTDMRMANEIRGLEKGLAPAEARRQAIANMADTNDVLLGAMNELYENLAARTHDFLEANRQLRNEIEVNKRTEYELRKLSLAVEHSPASIAITNARGIYEYVNPRFVQVTGYTLAELAGKTPRPAPRRRRSGRAGMHPFPAGTALSPPLPAAGGARRDPRPASRRCRPRLRRSAVGAAGPGQRDRRRNPQAGPVQHPPARRAARTGDARPADRPVQPPPFRRVPGPRGPARLSGRDRPVGADDRHRPLQALQRPVRTRGRRPRADRGGQPDLRVAAPGRRRLPFRRRGNRRGPARPGRGRRRDADGRHRRQPQVGQHPGARSVAAADHRLGGYRHAARSRRRRRIPGAGRRPRDVPGQARRAQLRAYRRVRAAPRRSGPASILRLRGRQDGRKGAMDAEQPGRSETHAVANQPPPLVDYNLFTANLALRAAVAREGAPWADAQLIARGAELGSAAWFERGELANRYPPELRRYDRFGQRRDAFDFHPAWHECLAYLKRHGVAAGPWAQPGPGSHVARAALFQLFAEVECGSLCPTTMTYGAVPAVARQPELARDWLPLLVSAEYDRRFLPASEKRGATMGMAMTEKQGGSDVRANTTRAHAEGGGWYRLVGHKWFFSAPMGDAFLVTAQAPGGLSCFFLPRFVDSGRVNDIRIERAKDKMGDRSNASAEVEFRGALARLVGEEGRGLPTILEMGSYTRLDCANGSTGLMRQALSQALHHARHRRAFGRPLAEQPLMRNVLADMALEVEAATALALRLARAFDRQDDQAEAALRRLLTPAAKFWICKRAPPLGAE